MDQSPSGEKHRQGKRSRLPTVRLGSAVLAVLSGLGVYEGFRHADAASANLQIIARLVYALDMTVNTTLDFGTLAMTMDRAGRATLDPGLNRLLVGADGSLSLAGGQPVAGRLKIRGANFPVSVSVEDTRIKLTNGTDTATVSAFNLLTGQGGIKMTFTPDQQTYSFTVPVGATLKTRPGQLSGTYVGTARIFASYQ